MHLQYLTGESPTVKIRKIKTGIILSFGCVYYSTIQISFSDLKKEIGNHSVISIFHFQFENEN